MLTVGKAFFTFIGIFWAADVCNGRRDNAIMLETHFQNILESIGEDPLRRGLLDTPKRAASALQFLTQGYQQSLDEIVNGALFPTHAKDMVLVKNIEFYSLCEHHLLPFTGKCHVAYLPNHAVLGISKIARIVDMYARRLQVQRCV